jgi:hypothetical protein
MQKELDGIAPELRALHARLVEIKKELQSLLKRNSPHAFSLSEVHILQDELREIDSAKMGGKYMNRDNPLRDVYEKLIRIRAQLEDHQETFRWTLNSASLIEIQKELGKIDNLRVDGKFLDLKGGIPEGQAVLHFLLHKCYRLVRKLVNSMEPVADELMPHYNQLMTLRKCLFELMKWKIQLGEMELLPYKMKIDAIESLVSS